MSVPSVLPPQGPADLPPFAAALDALTARLPSSLQKPRVGIVCGSGLSTLARSLRNAVHVPYSDIPGFGTSTVQGHQSALAFGLVGEGEGVPVVAMLGRFHPYEGHPLRSVVYPIRVLAKLGVKELIITNASGALNPGYAVGSIVTIADHVALPNLTGPLNALFGPTLAPDYPRFLPLSDAYSARMRRAAFHASVEMRKAGQWGTTSAGAAVQEEDEIPVLEGIYAYVSGPTYETPAEGRLLRAAGADVVGMSTVPEVLAAREEGLEVCVLSLVTNKVVSTSARVRDDVLNEIRGLPVEHKKADTVSHEEVLQVGREKAEVMRVLVERLVVRMYEDASQGRS